MSKHTPGDRRQFMKLAAAGLAGAGYAGSAAAATGARMVGSIDMLGTLETTVSQQHT